MRRFARTLVSALLLGLLPGVAAAHPAAYPRPASFDGVQFTYGSSLAGSVAGTTTKFMDMRAALPVISFRFDRYIVPSVTPGITPTFVIYNANTPALTRNIVLRADLEPDVAAFRALLRTRPTLSTMRYIPYLLPRMDSSELFLSRPHYLRFTNGSGVAFLTAMGMPFQTITNHTPVYWMFRGLTSDGRSVVVINLPVHVPWLPNAEFKSIKPKNFAAYARTIQSRLNRTSATSFTPYLFNLDKLATSLQVHPRTY